jgi:CheY-like chemotaxis protein
LLEKKKKAESTAESRDTSIVGHITSGTLHDFNNVLQGIIGLAEMLDADPSVPEKAKTGMKAIRRLGQNATQLVRSLGEEKVQVEIGTNGIEPIAASIETKPSELERKKILVAEDDSLVLNVIIGMLKHLGYTAVAARDGEEALHLYYEQKDQIGLIITDMIMPRLGGLDMAKKLLAEDSELKIVVMTGYLQDELEFDPSELGLAGWLEKPMTAERLRQLVASILE